jgi:RNA polymerase sigma factor (sigma-70 family)
MPRKLKTGKKNRTTYRYYNADGTIAVELHPGEDGITEADILLLHSLDDTEVDAGRREDYHVPGRYEAYHGEGDSDDVGDRNVWLADEDADPETVLIERQDVEEQARRLAQLAELLGSITPEQQDLIDALYRDGLSGRELARRLDVSEGAVRKRKNSLIESLRKKL